MSLAINIDAVTAVLVADGTGEWWDVIDESFELDSYEYVAGPSDDAPTVHGGGQSGVCATGFCFRTITGVLIAGPLTSILAVQYR